jgi:apolipoprotein N-acyltransferase
MRAAETGRWVLRAASTGISSIITPEGRVVEQAPLYRPAVLSHRAALLTQSSPGCRWGPIFSWVMFALAIAFVIAPAARPSGRRPARGAQPRSRPRRRG